MPLKKIQSCQNFLSSLMYMTCTWGSCKFFEMLLRDTDLILWTTWFHCLTALTSMYWLELMVPKKITNHCHYPSYHHRRSPAWLSSQDLPMCFRSDTPIHHFPWYMPHCLNSLQGILPVYSDDHSIQSCRCRCHFYTDHVLHI